MSRAKPAPVVTPRNVGFYDATARGALATLQCNSCGHRFLYVRPLCPQCWSAQIAWVDVSGRGRVTARSIVHRTGIESFQADVPYVLVVVRLEEGPTMMANIVGPDATEVLVGDPVEVTFEERDGLHLPQFITASAS